MRLEVLGDSISFASISSALRNKSLRSRCTLKTAWRMFSTQDGGKCSNWDKSSLTVQTSPGFDNLLELTATFRYKTEL
jgi:hypothetical protein